MTLIRVKKDQFKGYPQRWGRVSYEAKVNVPSGRYFKEGKQLIQALDTGLEGDDRYQPSSKHAYIVD